MAFPIIPKRRSGATGNPSSLQLGELAVNTLSGELYLGGDGGVMLLNPPTSAGTTVTEHTGDGTTTAFTFAGYNGTADGGYIVSVGGIDQPPSKYSISNTAGGTITFVEAPTAGELISIRAIVAGGGGGGSGDATSLQGIPISETDPVTGQGLVYNGTAWAPGAGTANATQLQSTPVSATAPTTGQGLVYNGTSWAPAAPAANATQIQGRNVAATEPTAGQFLAWNASTSKWEPQGGGGSVTFNTVGTHLWSVPASVRYAAVVATAGDGTSGTEGTNGAAGAIGADAYFDNETQTWIAPTTGANGADGVDGVDGTTGKSVTLAAISLALAGGAGGAKGLKGFGGGGSGGGIVSNSGYVAMPGAAGNGPTPGGGGGPAGAATGGAAGGEGATAGTEGAQYQQGIGGSGFNLGGNGGNGGYSGGYGGGGGGGGTARSGGGGGGGGADPAQAGTPGAGGTGTSGGAGSAGQTFTGAANFSAYAGGQVSIVISEGAGNASITITY